MSSVEWEAGTERRTPFRRDPEPREGNSAFCVAQISNLLYRSASSLRAGRHPRAHGQSADWKSAIQQVGNPRYLAGARCTGAPKAGAARPPFRRDQRSNSNAPKWNSALRDFGLWTLNLEL
ncbi:MAG: hypothetical protein C5B50_04395 [Verrucomicrobia bacterium]|nr:MAG: hypothetical protein C5B50_04395 [Verrucomicrobiota bacterium]